MTVDRRRDSKALGILNLQTTIFYLNIKQSSAPKYFRGHPRLGGRLGEDQSRYESDRKAWTGPEGFRRLRLPDFYGTRW
jgi:hypothetical protein